MEALANNSYIQYLDVSGNRVKDKQLFQDSLIEFLQENTRNLSHLDVSETEADLDLDLVFETVCQNSVSLQALHLGKEISLDFHQKLGHTTFATKETIFDQLNLT